MNIVKRKRECLRCGKPFWSEWSGNRICSRCNTTNLNVGRIESEMPARLREPDGSAVVCKVDARD